MGISNLSLEKANSKEYRIIKWYNLQEDSRDTNSAKGTIIFLSKNEQKENPVIFVVMQIDKSDKLYEWMTIAKENNLSKFYSCEVLPSVHHPSTRQSVTDYIIASKFCVCNQFWSEGTLVRFLILSFQFEDLGDFSATVETSKIWLRARP